MENRAATTLRRTPSSAAPATPSSIAGDGSGVTAASYVTTSFGPAPFAFSALTNRFAESADSPPFKSQPKFAVGVFSQFCTSAVIWVEVHE